MKKIPIIICFVFLVLFGGLALGITVGVIIGPQAPGGPAGVGDDSYEHIDNSIPSSPVSPSSPADPSPSESPDGGDDSDPQPQEPPHPLLGRWELAGTVDVDPQIEEGMATAMEFYEGHTGAAYHDDLQVSQNFTWHTESIRLTIIPADASLSVRTYEYEISEDILTIFYNTNRTSYAEMLKAD